jgi:transposase
MAGEFWLSGQQWAVLETLLPINQPGLERVDDRQGRRRAIGAGCVRLRHHGLAVRQRAGEAVAPALAQVKAAPAMT